ncbi:hypothetical protein [Bacteriovorax sp. DB6_IX]|nr:hypothetical protein [Bacteriovorax sp. DB6_IX]EQC51482.1 hypothetical protein M901_2804 [Bacteriovorax sp. DB6_IX]
MKSNGIKIIFLIIGLFIFKISVADTLIHSKKNSRSTVSINK